MKIKNLIILVFLSFVFLMPESNTKAIDNIDTKEMYYKIYTNDENIVLGSLDFLYGEGNIAFSYDENYNSQKFFLKDLGDGTFALNLVHSALSLTLTEENTFISMPFKGSDFQKFTIYEDENNKKLLKTVNGNKFIIYDGKNFILKDKLKFFNKENEKELKLKETEKSNSDSKKVLSDGYYKIKVREKNEFISKDEERLLVNNDRNVLKSIFYVENIENNKYRIKSVYDNKYVQEKYNEDNGIFKLEFVDKENDGFKIEKYQEDVFVITTNDSKNSLTSGYVYDINDDGILVETKKYSENQMFEFVNANEYIELEGILNRAKSISIETETVKESTSSNEEVDEIVANENQESIVPNDAINKTLENNINIMEEKALEEKVLEEKPLEEKASEENILEEKPLEEKIVESETQENSITNETQEAQENENNITNETNNNEITDDIISTIKGATENNQLIVVEGLGDYFAEIHCYERDENSKWKLVMEFEGFIGKYGFGKTVEGDRKSPTGYFKIGTTFGRSENPGTNMPYRVITPNDAIDDDPNSPTYNQWIQKEGSNALNIPQFDYGFVIGYNEERIPGAGSAILFHVSESYTNGCTGTDKESVIKVLRWLDVNKNPIILQCYYGDFAKY